MEKVQIRLSINSLDRLVNLGPGPIQILAVLSQDLQAETSPVRLLTYNGGEYKTHEAVLECEAKRVSARSAVLFAIQTHQISCYDDIACINCGRGNVALWCLETKDVIMDIPMQVSTQMEQQHDNLPSSSHFERDESAAAALPYYKGTLEVVMSISRSFGELEQVSTRKHQEAHDRVLAFMEESSHREHLLASSTSLARRVRCPRFYTSMGALPGFMYLYLRPRQVTKKSLSMYEYLADCMLRICHWQRDAFVRACAKQTTRACYMAGSILMFFGQCTPYVNDVLYNSNYGRFINSDMYEAMRWTMSDDCEGKAQEIATEVWEIMQLAQLFPAAQLIRAIASILSQYVFIVQDGLVTKSTKRGKPRPTNVEQGFCHKYTVAYPREAYHALRKTKPVQALAPFQASKYPVLVLDATSFSTAFASSSEPESFLRACKRAAGLAPDPDFSLALEYDAKVRRALTEDQYDGLQFLQFQEPTRHCYIHMAVDGFVYDPVTDQTDDIRVIDRSTNLAGVPMHQLASSVRTGSVFFYAFASTRDSTVREDSRFLLETEFPVQELEKPSAKPAFELPKMSHLPISRYFIVSSWQDFRSQAATMLGVLKQTFPCTAVHSIPIQNTLSPFLPLPNQLFVYVIDCYDKLTE